MIKFLPSYVGSKAYWVPRLECLDKRPIVELFAGSAVISSNYASSAILVELDAIVAKILSEFDTLIVNESLLREEYYEFRERSDWWRYAYMLQKMSFSGVFRYSTRKENGSPIPDSVSPTGYATKYNVPAKGHLQEIHVYDDYMEALTKWKNLMPEVINDSYIVMTADRILEWAETIESHPNDLVIVADPPYEGSQAAYNKKSKKGSKKNAKNTFDYEQYWDRVFDIADSGLTCLVFDRKCNLEAKGLEIVGERKMRVNGAQPGDTEALAVVGPNNGILLV